MSEPVPFYFAGELFDAKHLIGNATLAQGIETASEARYRAVLPQDLEQRSLDPHDIRDEDILALLDTDLALFHFDGVELDSGTVAEYMIAKFADIPAVIVRSDFRAGGDQEEHPWNLMLGFFPRTETVVLNALEVYKTCDASASPIQRSQALHNQLAGEIVTAFDKVRKIPPLMDVQSTETILEWLKKMPGFRRSQSELNLLFDRIRSRKLAQNQN